MNKYTVAEILETWEDLYGEDMTVEYPGFIDKLIEDKIKDKWDKEDEQKTWARQGPHPNQSLAMASGQRLQATSCKLQAPSRKLDKIKL